MGIFNAVKDAKLALLFTKMNDLDTRVLFDMPVDDCITMYDRLYKAFENSEFKEKVIDKVAQFDFIVSLFEFDRYSCYFENLVAIAENAGENVKKQNEICEGILKKYLIKIGEIYNKNYEEIFEYLDMIRLDTQNLSYEERSAYLASYILGDGEFETKDYEEIIQLVSKVIDPQYQYNTSNIMLPYSILLNKY